MCQIEWGLQFFSPSTQRLALITISGEEARMVNQPTLSPYPLSTFSTDGWQIDSDQALQTWWAYGGNNIAALYGQVDVVMQLRMNQEADSRLAWTVTGVNVKNNATLTLLIDAKDGTMTEVR
jgi:hypothetical protein